MRPVPQNKRRTSRLDNPLPRRELTCLPLLEHLTLLRRGASCSGCRRSDDMLGKFPTGESGWALQKSSAAVSGWAVR